MVHTFEYLRNNMHNNSDFIQKYLSLIDYDGDDDKMSEFNIQFVNELDKDIRDKIANGELTIKEIDNYEYYIKELELDEDRPDEAILIKDKPNINGTIIVLMLGCAFSTDSSLTNNTRQHILNMFQKATVFETYNNYIEIFPTFCSEVTEGNKGVEEAITGVGESLNILHSLTLERIERSKLEQLCNLILNDFKTLELHIFMEKYNNKDLSTVLNLYKNLELTPLVKDLQNIRDSIENTTAIL